MPPLPLGMSPSSDRPTKHDRSQPSPQARPSSAELLWSVPRGFPTWKRGKGGCLMTDGERPFTASRCRGQNVRTACRRNTMGFGGYSCSCCNITADASHRAFYIRLLPLGTYMILCDRCMKHQKQYAAGQPSLWDFIVEAHRNGALSTLLVLRTIEAATRRISLRMRRVAHAGTDAVRAFFQEISHSWTRCAMNLRERLWGGRYRPAPGRGRR